MFEIENTNQLEYKSIRIVLFFPILIFNVLLIMSIFSIINNQLYIIHSVTILVYIYIIILAFINYLVNLSHTRYFLVKIENDILVLNRGEKKFETPIRDIKYMIYLSEPKMTGSTNYLMIITKGLKRNIFLSSYKSKNIDFNDIMNDQTLSGKKVVRVRNMMIAQIAVLIYLTLYFSK